MSENQGSLRWLPNPPINPFIRRDAVESASSSDQVLRHPEGRTASSTDKGEDDEYSDENLRMWEEEDRLNPELAEWLKAQLRE